MRNIYEDGTGRVAPGGHPFQLQDVASAASCSASRPIAIAMHLHSLYGPLFIYSSAVSCRIAFRFLLVILLPLRCLAKPDSGRSHDTRSPARLPRVSYFLSKFITASAAVEPIT